MITSSGPGEGKSTTATNLAVTFAQTGSKVLIIDADLRKPRLHKIFNEANKFGLSNAIMSPERSFSFLRNTKIGNLSILSSGAIPPNPSELLGSNKMKQLIKELREEYDYIIIDSPPVGLLTDAQILATLSDGVLIVAASAEVTIDALNYSKKLLEAVNAKMLGVILNKLDKGSNGYYYYNYTAYEDESEGVTHQKPKKKKKQRVTKND